MLLTVELGVIIVGLLKLFEVLELSGLDKGDEGHKKGRGTHGRGGCLAIVECSGATGAGSGRHSFFGRYLSR